MRYKNQSKQSVKWDSKIEKEKREQKKVKQGFYRFIDDVIKQNQNSFYNYFFSFVQKNYKFRYIN